MNTQFVKRISLLFICFVAVSFGQAQNSYIESAFKNAININNVIDKGNGAFEFRSGECSFPIKDFNNYIKGNTRYVVTEVEYEYYYRFGYYRAKNVTRFSFRLNDGSSSSLEQAIRVANNNMSLKMPSFHDVKAADAFYKQYVKRHSKLAETYKKNFYDDFMDYTIKSPERIAAFFKGCPYNTELLAGFDVWTFLGEIAKSDVGISTFCNASPYDQEYLKNVNILQFLEGHRKDGVTYVYLKKPNEGYIVNKNMSYTGGIVNKQMHGRGLLEEHVYDDGVLLYRRKSRESYEGEFKNGRKNGAMTHRWKGDSYVATNDKIYSKVFDFRFEESGKMIDNQWVGVTDYKAIYEIKRVIYGDTYYEDHIRKQYDNGVVVSQTVLRNNLTSHLISVNIEGQSYYSIRIPRVKKVERSDNGVYAVSYEDGTKALQAYKYEDGRIVCTGGSDLYFIKTEDQAQRYAYLWLKYDNAHDMVVKNGLPQWR